MAAHRKETTMEKRSAMIIAGALVAAMMAGVVSRDLTLARPAPVKFVAQAATSTAQAAPHGDVERE
jgi:hypothetical protein